MANDNRLIEAIDAERPHHPEAHYDIGYNNGLTMAMAIAMKLNAVALPCKMGDVVWGIKTAYGNRYAAKQGVVNQMYFGDDMRLCICVQNICRGEWGKKVFATKEEAEAAIRERRQ